MTAAPRRAPFRSTRIVCVLAAIAALLSAVSAGGGAGSPASGWRRVTSGSATGKAADHRQERQAGDRCHSRPRGLAGHGRGNPSRPHPALGTQADGRGRRLRRPLRIQGTARRSIHRAGRSDRLRDARVWTVARAAAGQADRTDRRPSNGEGGLHAPTCRRDRRPRVRRPGRASRPGARHGHADAVLRRPAPAGSHRQPRAARRPRAVPCHRSRPGHLLRRHGHLRNRHHAWHSSVRPDLLPGHDDGPPRPSPSS